jgi:hypothetical protein
MKIPIVSFVLILLFQISLVVCLPARSNSSKRIRGANPRSQGSGTVARAIANGGRGGPTVAKAVANGRNAKAIAVANG